MKAVIWLQQYCVCLLYSRLFVYHTRVCVCCTRVCVTTVCAPSPISLFAAHFVNCHSLCVRISVFWLETVLYLQINAVYVKLNRRKPPILEKEPQMEKRNRNGGSQSPGHARKTCSVARNSLWIRSQSSAGSRSLPRTDDEGPAAFLARKPAMISTSMRDLGPARL